MSNELILVPVAKDIYLAAGAFFIILLALGLTHYLKNFKKIKEEYLRKFVHILVGMLAAIAPYFFSSPTLLILFAFIFGFFDFYAIKNGFFKGIHGSRFSYGTVYFPIAYLVLILSFWHVNKFLIFIGISFFAIPDAIAAITGQLFGPKSHKFIVLKDVKSIEGSFAFFVSGIILYFFSFKIFDIKFSLTAWYYLLFIILSINLVAVLVETLSSKGSDNLFVPLSVSIFTYIFLIGTPYQINQIFTAIILALIMTAVSHYLRFLTISGLVMTFLLALTVFGLGGLKWTVPILTFFVLSSILSKVGKGTKEKFKDTFEKSGTRDYAQVLANGGIAGIIVTINYFYPNKYLYLLYLLSLAVSTADTWATEIGVFSKTKPRMITSFKKVNPGVSGAISIYGTAGALLGSLVLIISGSFFFKEFNFQLFILLVIFGVLGSFIDSLLGATIQAQYICSICKKYTEKKIHCNNATIHRTGYKIITNDLVNFSSAALTIVLFYIFY